MKYEINKERLWIFSPVTNVVIKTDVSINNSNHILESNTVVSLKKAINCAVEHNEALKSKVVIESDGRTYFVEQENVNYSIIETNKNWKVIVKEQEKIPFEIQEGEYLRFFIIKNDYEENIIDNDSNSKETKSLLLIAHHLAGDGLSYAYLLQDIMKVLSGESIEKKSMKLFNMASLPTGSGLNFVIKLLLKSMNRKWNKTGKQFTFNEFKEMNTKYWNKHSSYITTYEFADSRYDSLISIAKENHVKINSLLTTAFIKAAKESGEMKAQDIGYAVSIRNKGYTGMGNFATGISIQYLYDNNKDFFTNAKCLQKLMDEKMNDDKKKYLLLQFMGNITGTLVDAIYFAAVEGYNNKTALNLSKMFGYNGNPKGISITNLTKLSIENKYGDYALTDFVFVPPLVMNAKRMIGVASLGKRMEISFVVEDDRNKEGNIQYFSKAMSIIELLVQ